MAAVFNQKKNKLSTAGASVPALPGSAGENAKDSRDAGETKALAPRRDTDLGQAAYDLQQLSAQVEEEQKNADEAGDGGAQSLAYGDESYHYFDYEHLEDGLNIPRRTRTLARSLIDRGEHEPPRISMGFENAVGSESTAMEIRLEGYNESGFHTYYSHWEAKVGLGQKKVLYAQCSSYDCYHGRDAKSYLGYTLCMHEVAALLLAKDYLAQNNVGDSTNASASYLMDVL